MLYFLVLLLGALGAQSSLAQDSESSLSKEQKAKIGLLAVVGPPSVIYGTKDDKLPQKMKVRRAISGRITDPNGGLVVGATITIAGRSHATVVKTSNVKGQYFADLAPDTYDVVVAAPGFKTATRRSTVVSRGSRSYLDFVLYPGETGSPIVIPPTPSER